MYVVNTVKTFAVAVRCYDVMCI